MKNRTILCSHLALEGIPYNIGKKLGDHYTQDADFIAFMGSPFMGQARRSDEATKQIMASFDRYCPHLNEEMQGFADAVHIDPMHIAFYFSYIIHPPHCSQVAILPKGSKDGKLYHGRNYDFGWDEPPVLLTVKSTESYAHIGFSLQLFGRYDGMNEKGLCVSTASSQCMPTLKEEGFVFPGVVRSLLDGCADVKEAEALLASIPISDCRNFLLSDASGRVTIVECHHSQKVIETVQNKSYAISMDHNQAEPFKKLNLTYPVSSKVRGIAARRYFDSQPKMGLDDLKALLDLEYPKGLHMPYYHQGMGTMWSIVFDPSDLSAHVRFGSNRNPWHVITLDTPATDYPSTFHSKDTHEDIYAPVHIHTDRP